MQYEIEAGQYRATVTELGAGLRELAFRGQPLIAGYEADELPPAGAGQLLAPWPNRVDGGRYVFGGTEYQLALTEPARGNAIHGLTRWAAWTAVQQDASAVRLRSAPHGQQGYPFGLEIEAEYRLDAGDRPAGDRGRAQPREPRRALRHRLASVPDRPDAVGRRLRADPARRTPGCRWTIAASRRDRRNPSTAPRSTSARRGSSAPPAWTTRSPG